MCNSLSATRRRIRKIPSILETAPAVGILPQPTSPLVSDGRTQVQEDEIAPIPYAPQNMRCVRRSHAR